jgi:HAD superfamily hydrolase (TIGR01490 family)
MLNQQFNYVAFFDVDETVISIKSMFSFLKYYSQSLPLPYRLMDYIKYRRQTRLIKKLSAQGLSRSDINIQYYRYYKGVKESLLRTLGNHWHKKCLKEINGFYNQKILSEIVLHKSNGAKIVLVSGSFFPCIEPIADYIKADFILATSLEVAHGKCTGKILNYPVIGEGKAKAIQACLERIGYTNYSNCYAYGDHISDVPMLNIVGNPVVVSRCEKLIGHAKEKNWRIISPTL